MRLRQETPRAVACRNGKGRLEPDRARKGNEKTHRERVGGGRERCRESGRENLSVSACDIQTRSLLVLCLPAFQGTHVLPHGYSTLSANLVLQVVVAGSLCLSRCVLGHQS